MTSPAAPRARRATRTGLLAVVGGAGAGLLVRALADGPSGPERAAAAVTTVLAVATVASACAPVEGDGAAARLASAGVRALTAALAAAAAAVAAGADGGVAGAACVVGGLAAVASGLAGALRRAGATAALASWIAGVGALLPAAAIFVADPWIDWTGGTAESPARAAAVLRASPLAAITSHQGGLGTDWQRMPWMYDGPAPGVPGLSLVGQYYPAIPPSAWTWAGAALAVAAALALVSRQRAV